MNSSNLTRKEIFKQLEEGKISAEEAFKIIKSLSTVIKEESVYYYEPTWKESLLTTDRQNNTLQGTVVLFCDEPLLGDKLKKISGLEVILVTSGEGFRKVDNNRFTVNIFTENDYTLLFRELAGREIKVDKIVYCWSEKGDFLNKEILEKQVKLTLFSLIYITQELQRLKQKGEIRLLYLYDSYTIQPASGAVGAFNRTVKAERPNYNYSSIWLKERTIREAAPLILNELKAQNNESEICYEQRKRLVKSYSPVNLAFTFGEEALKTGGVYLITGGIGGLGLIFAKEIAQNCRGKVILTGRSRLDESKQKKIEQLNSYFAEVVYLQGDVSKAAELENLLNIIRKDYGKIDGIIHSAGINRDAYLHNKQLDQVEEVISPKVYGTVELDKQTASDSLDFFILFSAMASVIGNAGQADYTYANSFMDYYIELREKLCQQGERSGKSLAISWPLWREGGMQVDRSIEEQFRRNWGMVPLRTEEGVETLYKALAWKGRQLLVIEGDGDRIAALLSNDRMQEPSPVDENGAEGPVITSNLQLDIIEMASEILNIKSHDLDPEDEFNDYGFDSISLTSLTNRLNERFKSELNPTIFFEHTTINEFIVHFSESHSSHLQKYYTTDKTSSHSSLKKRSEIVLHQEEVTRSHSPEKVKSTLLKMASSILKVKESDIYFEDELDDFGFDSIKLTELTNRINQEYELELTPAIFFEHPSLEEFSTHLIDKLELKNYSDTLNDLNSAYNLQNELAEIASEILGVKVSEIDPEDELDDYGFDSIKLTQFTNKINSKYSLELTPALFFEYTTLELAADHLEQEYKELFSSLYDKGDKISPQIIDNFEEERAKRPPHISKESILREKEWVDNCQNDDIAIIGMHGIFPGSEDPTEFWNNLEQGRDLIKEIPPERWRWQDYLNNGSDKETSRWGGFIDNIDCFDPLFFKISPQEAELMDPQQRLFLQTVWKAIENAGYSPTSLSGSKTGLFLGLSTNDYSELMIEKGLDIEAQTAIGTQHSIVANRISYLLNLHGPSIPVDTACSSSLVAIHYAVESIKNGSCDLAIAGGVNALLSPRLFISFSKAGMMSPEGRCKTFDDSAGGYVRGEGVGAIILKPLLKALEDKDFIYATIKGTAVNHGGHAKSLTAPNPNAQADLLVEAYSKADIDPATVGYIETHGTGTPLGDPIEINGLKKAFKELYNRWGHEESPRKECLLGSVKTNIGHLEAAAGIAGLIKVLLAMKHKEIPQTVHFTKQNRYIELADSPFHISDRRTPWTRKLDEYGRKIPRRAGISSFGFGGVNAHIVIEEHKFKPDHVNQKISKPQIVLLSAADEERLREYVEKMIRFIDEYKNRHSVIDQKLLLANIAYTLQMGRSKMDYRLATVATTIDELKLKLTDFLNSEKEIDQLKAGHIKSKSHDIHGIFEGDMGKLATELYIKTGKYFGMARAWVQGVEFDWQLLHNDYTPKKVPIPSYPFAKERYWLPESRKADRPATGRLQVAALHMMLDRNISTLQEQAFSKRFTNDEFYLRDHVFGGKCIVPGAALLEMIRAAGKLSTNQEVKRLENIIFSYPIVGRAEGRETVISLAPDKEGVKYELRGQLDSGAKVVHSEGVIKYGAPSQSYKHIDIENLKKEAIEEISPASFYKSIAEAGIESGRTDQTLKEIYLRKDGVLAKLALHSESKGIKDLTLHPSLLDGSFHTVTAWLSSELGESLNAHVLFSLESLEIIAPLEDNCYAYSTGSKNSTEGLKKYNITIYNHRGSPLVVMKNVTYKEVDAATLNKKRVETIYFKPIWIERELTAQNLEDRRPVIIFDEDDRFYNRITSDSKFLVTPTSNYEALLQAGALENPRIIFFAGCREDDIKKGLISDLETVFSLTKMLFERKVKKVELIYINTEQSLPADGTLAGLCKTVTAENPNYKYKTLNIAPDQLNPQLVMQELAAMEDIEVRYDAQLRKVKTITEIDSTPVNAMPLKKGGVYLITGGTGGLGLIFARYMVERHSANLVLTGRSPLDEKKKRVIDELSSNGVRVVYISSDVSNAESTASLITKITQDFGKLNGIIHTAGILNDSYILKKDRKTFRDVLRPKIDGTLNLDRATKGLSLDLFVLFSSTTAVTGNAGQADYAAANSFLDNFAFYRNRLADRKKRKGPTIFINWPLWREGGMQIDEAFEKDLAQTKGMEVLETEIGLKAFEDVLKMIEPKLIVFKGDRTKIKEILGINKKPIIKEETKSMPLENSGVDLNEQACKYLRELFAEELKLPAGKIKDEDEFEKYGIDSILIMQLNSAIEKDFSGLPKTLFFEYSTIKQLAAYFAENHAGQLQQMAALPSGQTTQSSIEPAVKEVKEVTVKNRFLPTTIEESKEIVKDIAIIGMDGRFPQAENLEQFWQVLKEGKDCIREIPPSRWNYRDYFDSDKNRKGMSYSKWGGFLKDIDKFEPLFFNISPREAEMMDPQERIFLETAWCCLENAGYTPESLKEGSPVVGVFAGAMWTDYQLYKANSPEFSKSFHPGSYLCYIPNRVSYTFGFTGPSVAMDTACSSSLTALHMACQSIINGECDAALAGGVNTISHPNRYQIYSYLNFASSEGKCRSFGADGDGYVAGEGSGVVLLKRLDKALEDGDYIYGVIKGSAINHGGKVSGLTVPNPNQQAAVISSALKKSGVDPRTISYLEAHGTGTSLGDPIEIRGLSKAYSEQTSDKQYCPIGSSKSNIGHLEAAAGIAQLLKVLLQMKYGKLVPSLHSDTLNPNIDFANSPFYVQHNYEDWNKPTINGVTHPRRAGISSFGAGGSNAHIIIEEYLMPVKAEQPSEEAGYLAILSTKREEQLKVAAANLLQYLNSGKAKSLRDICFTLQVGRQAMPYRLAIKGSTLEEFEKGLDTYISSGKLSLNSSPQKQIDINRAIKEANLVEIADYWLAGGEVDWPALYTSPLPQRVALPTYPFKKKSYWVPGAHILNNDMLTEDSYIIKILNKVESSELDSETANKILGEYYE